MVFRQCYRIMRDAPMATLAASVGCGAAVVQTFGYFVRGKVADNITYTDNYREAKSMTKEHPGTEYLFGKPMNFKALDADNIKRQCYLGYISLLLNHSHANIIHLSICLL